MSDMRKQFEAWAKTEFPEHYEDDGNLMFECDPSGKYRNMLVRNAWKPFEAGAASVQGEQSLTSIHAMCDILKQHYIEPDERTDCAILYRITFEQARALYDQGRMAAPAPVPQGEQCPWISVDERLPEKRDSNYQVFGICKKTYGPETNYPGQGVKGVYQDWVIRCWPKNFTHWMPIPLPPKDAQ